MEYDADMDNHRQAMALKKSGDLKGAVKLLIKPCHNSQHMGVRHQELFKIWRQFNRDDLKKGNYQIVIDRVLRMVKLDDENIKEMFAYWDKHFTAAQKVYLQNKTYFDGYRSLKISDVKALSQAAKQIENQELVHQASSLIERFFSKKV